MLEKVILLTEIGRPSLFQANSFLPPAVSGNIKNMRFSFFNFYAATTYEQAWVVLPDEGK
jgi:hypothetical protein